MREIVGEINGYDVVYIIEKDIIFCKNTAVKRDDIVHFLKGHMDKSYIPDKNLSIQKDNNLIMFGCLSTTLDNCKQINKQINRLLKSKRK